MRPAESLVPLLDGWRQGEMFFSPPLGFISTEFPPVNRMFPRGGGAPDLTRGT